MSSSKAEAKAYAGAAEQLNAAEAQLTRSRARLIDLEAEFTRRQLELAGIDRAADELAESDTDVATASASALKLSQRRVVAEQHATQIDRMLSAERGRVASIALDIERLEGECREIAKRYHEARFEEVAADFVSRNRSELSSLVEASFCRDAFGWITHDLEQIMLMTPRSLAAVWDGGLRQAVLAQAGSEYDLKDAPKLGKGVPPIAVIRSGVLTDTERSRMSATVGATREARIAAIAQPPSAPTRVDTRQAVSMVNHWRQSVVTAEERLSRLRAGEGEMSSAERAAAIDETARQLKSAQATLESWTNTLDASKFDAAA